jgi:hypothetical protein
MQLVRAFEAHPAAQIFQWAAIWFDSRGGTDVGLRGTQGPNDL